ncbi:hypothetical protein HRbin22_00842 [Candidatus Thermoflexus japonica]|uniref:Uncharacterized protein n=1 Tax=Candidatus Thermoflexus japonica TaxID=2035417 RepID=A0A2H5Y573_9CHLR|nr:hypothetical protein HRbin22_00842 [Candidatus Thermoflexus japonica]
MSRFTDDPKRNAQIMLAIRDREEDLVKMAEDLAQNLANIFRQEEEKPLSEKNHKERQLRNIQEVAEQSTSWAEVELFIRYQAARKEIYATWADTAIQKLKDLETIARSIVGTADESAIRKVHLELIRRVLGHTVRWHVWHAKGEPKLKQAQQGGGQ